MSTAWVVVFRVVLVIVVASTLNAVRIALTQREEFLAVFPGAAGWPLAAMAIVAAVGIVGKVGLWFWRRWAISLTVVTGMATIALDVIARAPVPHQVTVVIMTSAMLGLAWKLRGRFVP
jgi:hypothetical protein